jgi:peptidoglycan hydrolase-like protein with peptidoglycan-binding domain
MTPRLNAALCALVALSAGVFVNVTFLQRGKAGNWAARGALQPVALGANTEARPSNGTPALTQCSPVFGVGGHDAQPCGRIADPTASPQPGSTAGDVGRIADGASTFSASNGVNVIRAVQRELGRRGYKPGIANGVANVATRRAIMAYQHDHGLPLTGEPSNALLKAIVLGSSRAVRAPGRSISIDQGSRVGEVGRVVESASTLTASNGVDVIRAVQRELGLRGYKPGIPNGVANVATRGAVMAYQHDRGLPITGEPSEALLKAIVFENPGAARAPPNSLGTEQGNHEVPIIRAVIKPHSSTSRANHRTPQVASRSCAGAGHRASRSTCQRSSLARAKEPQRTVGPSARLAARPSTGWTASPRAYGREIITSSTSAPRPATSSTATKPMSEQKYLNSAGGSSGLSSLILAQFSQTAPRPPTPRFVHQVQGRQPATSEISVRPRFRPVPNSPVKFLAFPEVIR